VRSVQFMTAGGAPSTIHDFGSRGALPCRNSTRTTSSLTATRWHVVPDPQSSVRPCSSVPANCALRRCRILAAAAGRWVVSSQS